MSHEQIRVEKTPMSGLNTDAPVPRIKRSNSHPHLTSYRELGRATANPFVNWNNAFSEEFPQKEVMTVDLILQIKADLERGSQDDSDDEDFTVRPTRFSFFYHAPRLTLPSELTLRPPMRKALVFDSCFSGLSSRWN